MGRSPCFSQEGLNRGAWTASEDKILAAYVKAHGEGKWKNLPQRAGLRRSGKSCRLRWLNYLRPDIKRGNISHDEEELIIRLHNLLGNRWSLIAGRLPGRTDNEIKNYWNTTLGKKVNSQTSSSPAEQRAQSTSPHKKTRIEPKQGEQPSPAQASAALSHVIRAKATRCTKVLIPELPFSNEDHCVNPAAIDTLEPQALQTQLANYPPDNDNLEAHHEAEELHQIHAPDSDFFSPSCNAVQASVENDHVDNNFNYSMCMGPPQTPHYDEAIFEDWTSRCLDDRVNWDPDSLAFLLESEWP